MQTLKRLDTWKGFVAALVLAALLAACGGSPLVQGTPTPLPCNTSVGTSNFFQGKGEMVAIDIATGKPLWATQLPQLLFGGATVSNDLVFTTTFTGELIALSRQNGSVVWMAQLPAGSNATLAIVGNTLLAGAGIPLSASQRPVMVAYRPGA